MVEANLASVLNQTYEHYTVLYVDDNSQDDTYKKVCEMVGTNSKFRIIQNQANLGATHNYSNYLDQIVEHDDDILVHLDGDDWLYDDSVLEKLNNIYNEQDLWMSYGGFVVWDGTQDAKTPHPQNTHYPALVHKHKLYRRDLWRASHLRTYRYFLFKSIDPSDLISKIDNKPFWHASDLAWAYPCLEMCPSDKIGVADFYTHVYNATLKNQQRTQEREHADNNKFEDEIRNKKKYKQGLEGRKLPQISVYGDFQERHTIPQSYSFCYNRSFGDFDAVLFQDESILEYLSGSVNVPQGVKVIGRICENSKFFNQQQVVDQTLANHSKFDLILTWDPKLLKLPNSLFCPLTDVTQFNTLPTELPDNVFHLYPKQQLVSAISSNKRMLPGHVKRLEFIDRIKDRVDLFGRGIREIPSKLSALKDYHFSVVIENDVSTNYFTEKITDCFLTGTIPIYYGCPNIGEFFDTNGILTFTNEPELQEIITNLTPKLYQSKMQSIEANYTACFQYPTTTESMYNLYYKNTI